MSSELWIWKTAAACQLCGKHVELLGREWHHALEADHAVEVIVFVVPEAEEREPA